MQWDTAGCSTVQDRKDAVSAVESSGVQYCSAVQHGHAECSGVQCSESSEVQWVQ